jgi:hypothetical protein
VVYVSFLLSFVIVSIYADMFICFFKEIFVLPSPVEGVSTTVGDLLFHFGFSPSANPRKRSGRLC